MWVRLGLRRPLPFGRDRLLQLAELVVEVAERTGGIGILEVDRRCAALELSRVQQGGERLGDVVEDLLPAFLFPFDPFPVLSDAAGCPRLDLPEDVGVPGDELVVDPRRDGGEVALAPLLEQEREEVGLEQQVAELVLELRVVVRQRRVGDLVGLLDGVRDDRPRGLLPVPGTVAAQPLGQALEPEQGLSEPVLISQWWESRGSSACSRPGRRSRRRGPCACPRPSPASPCSSSPGSAAGGSLP
jgi:hypothetical protein